MKLEWKRQFLLQTCTAAGSTMPHELHRTLNTLSSFCQLLEVKMFFDRFFSLPCFFNFLSKQKHMIYFGGALLSSDV
jgi:hypothetical protein